MVTLAFILLAAQSAPVLVSKRTQDVELAYDISYLKQQTDTINQKLGTLLDRQHVIEKKVNGLLYGDIEELFDRLESMTDNLKIDINTSEEYDQFFLYMADILEEHEKGIQELRHAHQDILTEANEKSSEVDVRLYEEFGAKLLNKLSDMIAKNNTSENEKNYKLDGRIKENEYKIEDLKFRLDLLGTELIDKNTSENEKNYKLAELIQENKYKIEDLKTRLDTLE